jgi:hypothetical protein
MALLRAKMIESQTVYVGELKKVRSNMAVKDTEVANLKRDLSAEKSGNCTNFLQHELHQTLETLRHERANNLTDNLHKEVERLQRELTSEKTANRTKSLEKELTALRKNLKAQAENDQTVDLRQQVELLQQDLEKKTADNQNLRDLQFGRQQTAEKAANKIESLEQELTTTRNQLQNRTKEDHIVILRPQVELLRKRLAEETAVNEELRNQQKEREAIAQDTARRTKSLEEQLAALKVELDTQVKDDNVAKLRREVEKLRVDLTKETKAN